MYIFFGIFILICIFFAVFFHRRRKRIIQKIRNMSPCAQKKLLDELMHTSYLFNSVPYFFAWASKVLAAKTGAKMSAGKPKLLH